MFVYNATLTDSEISDKEFIFLTVDALHQPVEGFHLHAGIADYFHYGGQQFQFFHNLRKWIKSAVSLYTGISIPLTCGM